MRTVLFKTSANVKFFNSPSNPFENCQTYLRDSETEFIISLGIDQAQAVNRILASFMIWIL